MSSGAGSGSSSVRGQRLLLRFLLPGLPPDEVYVTRKLSIGRTPDNVFVIADPAVDRHHAVVETRESADGVQFVLECVAADGFLEVEGRREHALVLQPGVRFRIGPAEFECVAAAEAQPAGPKQDRACCPWCGHRPLPAPAD